MPEKPDPKTAIIEPSIYKLGRRSVDKKVVIVFRDDHLTKVASLLGYPEKSAGKISAQRYFPPPRKGMPGLAGPAIGAPHAVILLEALVALGAKTIIGFGFCGSISKSLSIGQAFVPTKAISEEGTSPHYFDNRSVFETDGGLTEKIMSILHDRELAPVSGPIWTTDAVFRETHEKVERHRENGALAVDMETSALCAVAEFRSVRYLAVMVVSDELATGVWKPGFASRKLKKTFERLVNELPEMFL